MEYSNDDFMFLAQNKLLKIASHPLFQKIYANLQKPRIGNVSETLYTEVLRLLRNCASQTQPLLLNQHLTYIDSF